HQFRSRNNMATSEIHEAGAAPATCRPRFPVEDPERSTSTTWCPVLCTHLVRQGKSHGYLLRPPRGAPQFVGRSPSNIGYEGYIPRAWRVLTIRFSRRRGVTARESGDRRESRPRRRVISW